jgi:glycosyltransferase involved in cell wall biosynthesis
VHTTDVAYHGNQLQRAWRFLKTAIRRARRDHDLVYVYYFPGCSALGLAVRGTPVILDVRTAATTDSALVRQLLDWFLRAEAAMFRHVAVVSAGVRDRLHLANAHVIPLGADVVPVSGRSVDALRLLYVGTLRENRRMSDTIEGFAQFCVRNTDLDAEYTVIGEGDGRKGMERLAEKLGIAHRVQFTGYVPHGDLSAYLEWCNVGVSYVPVTCFYNHQPPTKTFEYLLAGIPVIATATDANRQVVDHTLRFSWPEIMRNNARPFIEGCLERAS